MSAPTAVRGDEVTETTARLSRGAVVSRLSTDRRAERSLNVCARVAATNG